MKTSERYDAMPYPTKFFAQTNPVRMSAFGTLLGLEPADPGNCRVLEFGCGDGSNLISHAYTLPGSEFIGIDISGEHIRKANSWAGEIGLSNVEFRQCDVLEMNVSDFGKFDYLVAHGLITWVPEVVTERVFELFGALLSERGIGYVSYNCYPGAHLREMVREMMMFHTKNIESPLKKVEAATSFLSLIANNTSDQGAYRQVLAAENKRHADHVASDVFHDDLSDSYYPARFSEIAARLEENGLEYLCEADYQSMSPRNLSPDLQEFFKDIRDPRELEDYMDFARGRQFRKTLFCRKGSTINRELTPGRLSKIAIASTAMPGKPDEVEKESTAVRFVSQLGAGIEIDHLVTKMVLAETGQNAGIPINLDDVLEHVKQTVNVPDWDHEEEICRRILLRLIEDTAMLDLYSHAFENAGNIPERPNASPLAKWQVRVGDSVTSRFGSVIGLDDAVAKHLIGLCDGSRTVSEIKAGIREFVDAEGIGNEVRSDLGVWVEESLLNLTRIGIITDD